MKKRYRLYLMDGNRRVSVAHDIHCPDDDAASHTAAQMSKGQWWELWRGREKIRYGKGSHHAPADPLH